MRSVFDISHRFGDVSHHRHHSGAVLCHKHIRCGRFVYSLSSKYTSILINSGQRVLHCLIQKRCVCCRSHVDDGVYPGLHSVLCQILHHWSHCVGCGCPRRLTSRRHHLSGLLCEGKRKVHLLWWKVDREVVLQPLHSVNSDHLGQRGAEWAGFYFYIFLFKGKLESTG